MSVQIELSDQLAAALQAKAAAEGLTVQDWGQKLVARNQTRRNPPSHS